MNVGPIAFRNEASTVTVIHAVQCVQLFCKLVEEAWGLLRQTEPKCPFLLHA